MTAALRAAPVTAATAPVRRATRGRSPRVRRRRWLGLVYLAPVLVVYAAVVVVPTGQTAWLSFYSWNGITAARWAGVSNYTSFLSDPQLRSAVAHTVVLLGFYAVLPIVLGLLSAALLTARGLRGLGVFRTIIFLPQVLTSVVIAVVWRQLYAPDGPLNTALRAVGVGVLAHDWLGSFTLALPALGLVGTWSTFGLCMVLFVSGVQSIPLELFDAARVDGAGRLREFFAVTLPALRGPLAVALTLTVIAGLRAFDIIWLTTRGGPGAATTTPAIELYSRAFIQADVGAAAAVGVVLAAVSLAVALVILRLSEGADR